MSYNPQLMRWMEEDPAGYVDGLNVYQSEISNPANFLDPNGTNRYQTSVTSAHNGVAVDTWTCENGKWKKTGVKTFDFSVDWDSNFWWMGAIMWRGKVVESDGLTLESPETFKSNPNGDVRMLAFLEDKVKSPPLYGAVLSYIWGITDNCRTFADDAAHVGYYDKYEDCCDKGSPATQPTSSTQPATRRSPSTQPATTQPAPSSAPRSSTAPYTVRRGDNLWRIARQQYGKGSSYPAIIGANPGLSERTILQPGQVLQIPTRK